MPSGGERPLSHRLYRRKKVAADGREFVLHAGRNFGEDSTGDESIAFDIANGAPSGLLTLAYLPAGGRKLTIAQDEAFTAFPWAERAGLSVLRTIGALEVLGAIGLILPMLTGILPLLTPIAAVGLVLVQIVAIALHVRRGEFQTLPVNVVLLLLALFVAIARFAGV